MADWIRVFFATPFCVIAFVLGFTSELSAFIADWLINGRFVAYDNLKRRAERGK